MVEESCWLRGFGVVGTILGINVSLLGIPHLSVTELSGEVFASPHVCAVARAITARGGLKRPLSPITNPLLDCQSTRRTSCLPYTHALPAAQSVSLAERAS